MKPKQQNKQNIKEMRKVLFVVIGAALMVCASCKRQISESEISFESDSLSVAVDSTGNAVTGEIWNEDHRVCQETVDGRLVRVTVYHENGQKAFVTEMDENGAPKDGVFYNEKGEVITPQQFGQRYSKIIQTYGWIL